MRDYRDAKSMAQTLRDTLSERKVALSHGESLELVAKVLGVRDWNTLSAQIQAAQPATKTSGRRGPRRAKSADGDITLPLVPLRDVVVFPNMTLPLFAGRNKTIQAIEHAMQGDGRIFLSTQKMPAEENPGADGIHKIGVLGTILNALTSEGILMSFARGHRRAEILHFAEHDDFNVVRAMVIEDDCGDMETTRKLSRQLWQEIPTYANAQEGGRPIWLLKLPDDSNPGLLADVVAARLPIPLAERQRLLETVNVASRIERILAFMRQGRQAA